MRWFKNLSPGVRGPVPCVVPFWCPCLLSHVLFCISCRLLLCLMSSGITHGTEIAFASGCGSAGVGGKEPRARGGIAWIMPSRWSSSLSFSAPLSSFTVGRGSTGAAPSAASCSVSSRVATSTWRWTHIEPGTAAWRAGMCALCAGVGARIAWTRRCTTFGDSSGCAT